jgi:hypothetical protein
LTWMGPRAVMEMEISAKPPHPIFRLTGVIHIFIWNGRDYIIRLSVDKELFFL